MTNTKIIESVKQKAAELSASGIYLLPLSKEAWAAMERAGLIKWRKGKFGRCPKFGEFTVTRKHDAQDHQG